VGFLALSGFAGVAWASPDSIKVAIGEDVVQSTVAVVGETSGNGVTSGTSESGTYQLAQRRDWDERPPRRRDFDRRGQRRDWDGRDRRRDRDRWDRRRDWRGPPVIVLPPPPPPDWRRPRYRGGRSSLHVEWCLNRYRSYDPRTDMYRGYDGVLRYCRSPYR
jgi:hypothetical protein